MFPSLPLALVTAFAVTQVAVFVTTVWLHRTLAHRALALAPAPTALCRVLTWVTTGIRPRQWVAVHRRHHAYTDVPGDPHSPKIDGFWRVQLANAWLYRRVARDRTNTARYARDLPADRWDRALFDHALVGLGIGVAGLWVLLGPFYGTIAAGVHAGSYLLLSAAINAVGHRFGRQVHPNSARNSQWLAWLTAGEGLHNNHHAVPTSARLALQPGEFDPGWWVVRLLERAGLAHVRRAPVHSA
jgi:stearoyl-CoA desaturase (delta-9 desaturase)